MKITVMMKQAGRRRNSIAETKLELEGTPGTLRELLCFSVRACVRDFKQRQQQEPMLLTEEEIKDKASAGRVGFGFFYGNTVIDEQEAVDTAAAAFEDGLVVIFLDGSRKERLDEIIRITEETKVTFVRLTMLAGRMY